jgi:hypothetical protein
MVKKQLLSATPPPFPLTKLEDVLDCNYFLIFLRLIGYLTLLYHLVWNNNDSARHQDVTICKIRDSRILKMYSHFVTFRNVIFRK